MPSTSHPQETKIAYTLEASPIHTIDVVRSQGFGFESRRIGIAESVGGSEVAVPCVEVRNACEREIEA